MGDIQNTQKKTYIMALDQGTTSSRCILFDKQGNICSMAQKEFTQIYPQPGWVEHNPMEIWSSQLGVAIESMAVLGITDDQIEAIGITNQRETTILWDKNTGEPVYNAIVWQCRRTSDMIEELKKDGFDKIIREKTGLIPDAYFSASKIAWILNNVPGARERRERRVTLRYGGYLADLESDQGRRTCDGLYPVSYTHLWDSSTTIFPSVSLTKSQSLTSLLPHEWSGLNEIGRAHV